MTYEWFYPIQDFCPAENPRYEELFREQCLVTSLVRELIQNAIDARLRGSTALVRFRIVWVPGHTMKLLIRESLREHWRKGLNATDAPMVELLDDVMVPILVAEDYNTTGLEGDPFGRLAEDGSFAAFFNENGGSAKHKGGGRFGIGKNVAYLASHLQTLLAYTVRTEAPTRLFRGQVLFNHHRLGADPRPLYRGRGIFCAGIDAERQMPIPYEGEAAQAIAQMLGMQRAADETGLSLAIPLPRRGIDFEGLVEAALQNFSVQLKRGDVVIEVTDGAKHLRLDPNTVTAELDSRIKKERSELANARIGIDLLDREPAATVDIDLDRLLEAGAESLADRRHGATLDELRAHWARKESLRFRIRVDIPRLVPGRQEATRGTIVVTLRNEGQAALCVRDGVTLKGRQMGAGSYLMSPQNSDDAASHFLGDCETPSHAAWLANRLDDQGHRYLVAPSKKLLSAIQSLPQHLCELLNASPDQQVIETPWDALFRVQDPAPLRRERNPERNADDTRIPTGRERHAVEIEVEPLPAMAGIHGFVIRLSQEGREAVTHGQRLKLKLQCGYATHNARAFSSHHRRFDFDLAAPADTGLAVRCTGGTYRAPPRDTKGNTLELVANRGDFEFQINGFDVHRRVDVQCDRI